MAAEDSKKILIVEDESDLLELIQIAFEAEGYRVEGAPTGEEALKDVQDFLAKKEERPSAVILDLLLPGISGMNVLKEMRKHAEFNEVPIVVFTNYSSDSVKKEIEEFPNTKYLLKVDVTPRELVGIVEGLV